MENSLKYTDKDTDCLVKIVSILVIPSNLGSLFSIVVFNNYWVIIYNQSSKKEVGVNVSSIGSSQLLDFNRVVKRSKISD